MRLRLVLDVKHYGWRCPDCEQAGWTGYCARLRCYCGHDACTAHRSWQPPPRLHAVPPAGLLTHIQQSDEKAR